MTAWQPNSYSTELRYSFKLLTCQITVYEPEKRTHPGKLEAKKGANLLFRKIMFQTIFFFYLGNQYAYISNEETQQNSSFDLQYQLQ